MVERAAPGIKGDELIRIADLNHYGYDFIVVGIRLLAVGAGNKNRIWRAAAEAEAAEAAAVIAGVWRKVESSLG